MLMQLMLYGCNQLHTPHMHVQTDAWTTMNCVTSCSLICNMLNCSSADNAGDMPAQVELLYQLVHLLLCGIQVLLALHDLILGLCDSPAAFGTYNRTCHILYFMSQSC